jgi:hypothetical protein
MLRSGFLYADSPIHSYTVRLVATAVTLGVIGAAAALSPRTPADVPSLPLVGSRESVATSTVIAPPPSTVHLVFRAEGATYLKLRDADPMPAHGRPVLHEASEASAWQTVSIADTDDVPGWRGRIVTIDGTCQAKVIGFAVVARLTGSPDYAGDFQTWTADNVLATGAPVVAAQLDGCDTGAIATTAIPLVVRSDDARAKQAREKLLASTVASDAQRTWRADKRKGDWFAADSATFETIVVRDAAGVDHVSVTGRIDEGCGGPEIQIWGLYRVDGDELVVLQQRALGEVRSISALLDLDDDGTLEVLGKSWLGNETILWRPTADEEVTRDRVPFYGCPC